LKKQPNLVPVISIEGFKTETDERRGDGIHDLIEKPFIISISTHILGRFFDRNPGEF